MLVQGRIGTDPGQEGIPLQSSLTHPHIHPHSYWDKLDMLVNLLCTSVEHGSKPEYPEKIRAGVGKISKLHIGMWPPAGINFFSSHQCYNEMILNKIMLLKGPAISSKVAKMTNLLSLNSRG